MQRRAILLIAFLMAAVCVHAQYDEEYKMEIGGGAGLLSYEGDFNGSIAKNMQPMATAILRRVFNPYMALRAAISYGTLKGDSRDVTTFYPDYQVQHYAFSHSVADACVVYEYNFWPYGTGRDYRGARRLTPFVFGGIGATMADTGDGSVFTANLPIGVGVKYKVAPRLNLSMEWAIHFSQSDKLDGVTDPYQIKSSGLFKNRDSYSMLQLSLTYSFMPKCRTCNNDKDD